MKFRTKDITLKLASILMVWIFTSCGGDQPKTISQKLNGISKTVKSIDTAAAKFSKGASEFSKKIEKYVDTSKYKKDSLGKWQKKQ